MSARDQVRAATWAVDGNESRVRWTPPTGFNPRVNAASNFVKGYKVYISSGRVLQIDNPFRVDATLNRTTFPTGYPRVSVLTRDVLEVGDPVEGPRVAAQLIDAPIRWVSMGDSYAAGDAADGVYASSLTGLPSSYGSTTRGDNACWRTSGAWSPQLVERFGGSAYINYSVESATGRKGDHIACSGDTASGMLFDQLPHLGTDVDVVTLMIGGNDIGFGTYAANCAVHVKQPKPQDCDPRKPAGGHVGVGDVAERVETVIRAIRLRAPAAQVIVGTYPEILRPAAQIDQRHYTLGRLFIDSDKTRASFQQITAQRFSGQLQTALNSAITAGASRAGAAVVDMSGATNDHWLNVSNQWGGPDPGSWTR